MPRYCSRRHRKLMDQSEFALRDASASSPARVVRVVNTLLDDSQLYQLWESRHADLLLPVAEQKSRKPQVVALRNAEVQLVHRRAMFRYLRVNKVSGEERRQVFRTFHSNIDYHRAVIAEHRQYMLAVSSRVSADHLIDVMEDPKSIALLQQYETLYTRYFEMQCYVNGLGDSDCVDLVATLMNDSRDQLKCLRQRIDSENPENARGSFDRQEVLARSGRYPVLNYMVG